MKTNEILTAMLLTAVMALVWARTRKRKETKHFDEMQLKIRADGYKLGFFTTLALLALLILLSEMDMLRFISVSFGAFAVLMTGVIAFAAYCILHEAFLSVGDRGRYYLLVFSAVTLFNGVTAAALAIQGKALEDGVMTLSFGAPALLFMGFLTLLTVLIVKMHQMGKEAAE